MTKPKPDIDSRFNTIEGIKKIMQKIADDSSKQISDYVCGQVAETIAPIYRMLSELAKRQEDEGVEIKDIRSLLEDHERRIRKLEKLIG